MHPVQKTYTAGQQVLKSALREVHPSCHSVFSTHNLFFLPGPEVEKAPATHSSAFLQNAFTFLVVCSSKHQNLGAATFFIYFIYNTLFS